LSIVDIFASGASFVKSFRAFRALRPLRVVRRYENLKVIVESIFKSLPNIMNVLLVTMLFYVIFGILGVQLFGGLFFRCESPDRLIVHEDVDRAQCDEWASVAYQFMNVTNANNTVVETYVGRANATWVNPVFGNFDYMHTAFLLLFEIGTMEMWPQVMYRAVDISDYDQAPLRDNMQSNAIFFVIFITVSAFFLMQLFVGVVIQSFQRIREESLGSAFLSEKQRLWLEVQRLMLYAKSSRVLVRPPPGRLHSMRNYIFEFVQTAGFESFIAVCIVLNILTMAMWHHNQSYEYAFSLLIVNLVFSAIFFFEMCLKLAGLGTNQYFSNRWNLFDFLIVMASLFSIGMDLATDQVFDPFADSSSGGFDPTILRVFRFLRIFRLVRKVKGLFKLIRTLILSAPALMNVGMILLLLFFVYAVAGVNLFGGLPYGSFLNKHANFDHIGYALLTLFRMSTGESWNGIMRDAMPNEFTCIRDNPNAPEGEVCGSAAAVPFFVTFVVFGQFMMLNLFIAVILEAAMEDESRTPLSLEDLNMYARLWSEVYLNDPGPVWAPYHFGNARMMNSLLAKTKDTVATLHADRKSANNAVRADSSHSASPPGASTPGGAPTSVHRTHTRNDPVFSPNEEHKMLKAYTHRASMALKRFGGAHPQARNRILQRTDLAEPEAFKWWNPLHWLQRLFPSPFNPWMRWDRFQLVMKSLEGPLAVSAPMVRASVDVFITLPIPVHARAELITYVDADGRVAQVKETAHYVHYAEGLLALAHRAFLHKLSNDAIEVLRRKNKNQTLDDVDENNDDDSDVGDGGGGEKSEKSRASRQSRASRHSSTTLQNGEPSVPVSIDNELLDIPNTVERLRFIRHQWRRKFPELRKAQLRENKAMAVDGPAAKPPGLPRAATTNPPRRGRKGGHRGSHSDSGGAALRADGALSSLSASKHRANDSDSGVASNISNSGDPNASDAESKAKASERMSRRRIQSRRVTLVTVSHKNSLPLSLNRRRSLDDPNPLAMLLAGTNNGAGNSNAAGADDSGVMRSERSGEVEPPLQSSFTLAQLMAANMVQAAWRGKRVRNTLRKEGMAVALPPTRKVIDDFQRQLSTASSNTSADVLPPLSPRSPAHASQFHLEEML
jgi:hypothetical protein